MNKILKEYYDIRPFKIGTTRKGGKYIMLFISATEEDSLNPALWKDIKEYGIKFNPTEKIWYLMSTEENYENDLETRIKPCYEKLLRAEKFFEENGITRSIEEDIDILINAFKNDAEESNKELLLRLEKYKDELMTKLTLDEYVNEVVKIVTYQVKQMSSDVKGGSFSVANSILALQQDPESTLVKADGIWRKYYNRRINYKNNPRRIRLLVYTGSEEYDEIEKEKIRTNYLNTVGAADEGQLSGPQKDELRHLLMKKDVKRVTKNDFELIGAFFDVRFTEPIDPETDVINRSGNTEPVTITRTKTQKISDLDWYNPSTEETEDTICLYDSIVSVINKSPLKLRYVSKGYLGTARGSAGWDGNINIPEGSPKSIGFCSTLIHEFAHQLLHINVLKGFDKDEYSRFYQNNISRNIMEQQAEFTAWLVLREFGYGQMDDTDLNKNTHLNYMHGWGMKNGRLAIKIFDAVAETASYIIRNVRNEYDARHSDVQLESRRLIFEEENIITGLDVAEFFGLGDLYMKYASEMNESVKKTKIMFNRLNNVTW